MGKTFHKISLLLTISIMFRPGYFALSLPIYNSINRACLVVVCSIVFVRYLWRGIFSKYIIALCVYFLLTVLSTALNNENVLHSLINAAPAIGLCMLIEMETDRDPEAFLFCMTTVLFIFISINTLTMILYPEGWADLTFVGRPYVWFLGYKNNFITYTLPGACSSFLYSYLKHRRINLVTIILYAMSLITSIHAKASTGSFVLLLLLFYFTFVYKKKTQNLFNSYTYAVGFIIVYVGLIFFRVQEYFSFLIVDILQKNLTFTTRTTLWDMTIRAIQESPWLGYGFYRSNPIELISETNMSSHNQLLMITYRAGIFGLIAFLFTLVLPIRRLYRFKNNEISKLLAFVFLLVFLASLMEELKSVCLYFIPVMSYAVEQLIPYRESDNQPKSDTLCSAYSSQYIIRP